MGVSQSEIDFNNTNLVDLLDVQFEASEKLFTFNTRQYRQFT